MTLAHTNAGEGPATPDRAQAESVVSLIESARSVLALAATKAEGLTVAGFDIAELVKAGTPATLTMVLDLLETAP